LPHTYLTVTTSGPLYARHSRLSSREAVPRLTVDDMIAVLCGPSRNTGTPDMMVACPAPQIVLPPLCLAAFWALPVGQ
jgi:hypothetical protein